MIRGPGSSRRSCWWCSSRRRAISGSRGRRAAGFASASPADEASPPGDESDPNRGLFDEIIEPHTSGTGERTSPPANRSQPQGSYTMIRWMRTSLFAVLALVAGTSYSQTCTTTVSPGADLEATVAGMTSGQVLCLNAGTYTAPAGGFNAGVFDFGVGVTIRGLGASPAATVLQ